MMANTSCLIYFAILLQTEPIGTVVYTLIVSDLDEGLNGRLTFSVPVNASYLACHLYIETVVYMTSSKDNT